MDAREDLPKVSIETEQDWRRIQQSLSAAFVARLDTELESLGETGVKDEFSPHVHQVISPWFVPARAKVLHVQFLEAVFDIARPNLRINGRTSTTDEPCSDEDGELITTYSTELSTNVRRCRAIRRSTRPPHLVVIRPKVKMGQGNSRPSTLKTR